MLLHRTHLSAHEIAMLELDGLPATKRGVNIVADREGWSWVERKGRGGGRLYAVADLPEPARRDFHDRAAALPSGLRPVGRPRGTDFFTRHPDVADAVEAYISQRKLSAPVILKLLSTRFAELPSRRTLSRFIAELERTKPALLASVLDPDGYKSKYRVSLGRADAAVTHAHQIWEIDTTRADVLCKEGRKSILGIVDVWSRRAFYLVCDSESGLSVRRALVGAMRRWGVMPEILRTDNGSGYINDTVPEALAMLGIEHRPVPPASGDKKPFVERLFGTFTRERAELLAGYIGHSVAEAAQLRARARKTTGRAVVVPEITAAELQAIIDAWLDGEYHLRVHSTTGATPFDRCRNSPHPAVAAPDETTLKRVLSDFVGPATVTKRGIRYRHGRYWSPRLVEYMGRTVHVRRDEDDLGALYVFDEDGRYIDVAVNAQRSGMSELAFATEARRQQAEEMAAAKAELRAKQRKYRIEDARDALLRRDAERAGKLAMLPVATRASSTPTIDSLANAPAVPAPAPAKLAQADRILRATPAKTTTAAERIARTDRVLADHEAGRPVDPADLQAARVHAQSSEYRAEKILRGTFARPAPVAPSTTVRENRL
ncbi:MAG TPA: Mu transposase C-terminal domain-containing protein [Sphingomonas sp.]|nr:Mu transposase C-terminal domain-containing protein [Sphingomonas sp.]